MTLREIIAAHEERHQRPVSITPRGRAHVAGRRFLEAISALTPEERETALAVVVTSAPAGPAGHGFSLLISHEPTRDPQTA